MRDRVKVKLTHDCGADVARGMPGDILEVTPSVARWLVERGGAEIVEPAPEPERMPEPAAPAETATAGPAENAATRTGPPPTRRPGGAGTKK